MIVAIGMDPGPTPGLVCLTYTDEHRALNSRIVQCNSTAWDEILRFWFEHFSALGPLYFGVEQFVIGTKGNQGTGTKEQVSEALAIAQNARIASYARRSASQVKAWATDERLDRAGLLEATKGMRHARDAARHALYTACKDAGVPDPLSRRH